MIEIPESYALHLKKFARLRRSELAEAVHWALARRISGDDPWLLRRYPDQQKTVILDIADVSRRQLMQIAQGLPPNIRPVTDGPYLKEFSLITSKQKLVGIEAEGLRIFDFKRATDRDVRVYELVADLLPNLTPEQFRAVNTFNAQYLRLVREPRLFTMPTGSGPPSIDAGAYVGHKAFALAKFCLGPTYAIEMDSRNYELLELNISENSHLNVRGLQVALSDVSGSAPMFSREAGSMAQSLEKFQNLKEGAAPLLSDNTKADDYPPNGDLETVEKETLDENFPEGDFDAIHISVNGHEPEVVRGATGVLRRARLIRISCPYLRDDVPVIHLVRRELERAEIPVVGKSGGAIVAGDSAANYHYEKF